MAIPFFFSACFAFASRTVTVLHHLPVPVIHVVTQSTMLLGVESVCISTGPPTIQMQLLQHITILPKLSGDALSRFAFSMLSVNVTHRI
jgi:hypothetical protein